MNRRIYHSILAIVTATVFAGTSTAEAEQEDKNYSITYRASELSTPAGMKRVHDQIKRAAADYCPNYSKTRSLPDIRHCREGVERDLVNSVGNARFVAYVKNARDEEAVQLGMIR